LLELAGFRDQPTKPTCVFDPELAAGLGHQRMKHIDYGRKYFIALLMSHCVYECDRRDLVV
jgi:hypothetical protein